MAVTRVDEFVLGQVLPHKSISVAPELKMTLIINTRLISRSVISESLCFHGL
jgi:hypothetical protein